MSDVSIYSYNCALLPICSRMDSWQDLCHELGQFEWQAACLQEAFMLKHVTAAKRCIPKGFTLFTGDPTNLDSRLSTSQKGTAKAAAILIHPEFAHLTFPTLLLADVKVVAIRFSLGQCFPVYLLICTALRAIAPWKRVSSTIRCLHWTNFSDPTRRITSFWLPT